MKLIYIYKYFIYIYIFEKNFIWGVISKADLAHQRRARTGLLQWVVPHVHPGVRPRQERPVAGQQLQQVLRGPHSPLHWTMESEG